MLPEDFVSSLMKLGLMKFWSNYDEKATSFILNSEMKVDLKKGPHGLLFKIIDSKDPPKPANPDADGKDWAEWHLLPGF